MDAKLTERAALEGAVVDALAATARPMRWGHDDCGLWVASILQGVLGYDAGKPQRGRYRTRRGAARVLGQGGLPGALRAAARRHGWHRIELGQELAGDVALAMIGEIPVTLICRAPGWLVGRNENGFTALPASAARIIWAVI